MPAINFSNFTLATPRFNDFLVGYRGSTEIRTTLNSLTSLNAPFFGRLTSINNRVSSYESCYTTVNINSGSWYNASSIVNSNSSNWNNTYSYTSSTSAEVETSLEFIKNTLAIYNEVSAGWNFAYLFALSGVPVLSALQVTQTVYQTNSAIYSSTYTTANELSGNFYSVIPQNSAHWNQSYTLWSNNSATYDHYWSVVVTNSANWDFGYLVAVSAVPAISALQATQAAYQTTSATYVTYSSLSTASVTMSAVTIVHSLSVIGEIVIFKNLPTTSAGLPQGAVWNDAGFLKIV